jgi:hypothetical protein
MPGVSRLFIQQTKVNNATLADTASYALNGGGSVDTSSFVTTSSFNAFTSSINSFTSSINTSSFVTTSSFNAFTGSYNTGSFTGSFTGLFIGTASNAINAQSSSLVNITATNADSVHYIHFGEKTIGYDAVKIDNGISYNPLRNTLTVSENVVSPNFVGTASWAATSSFALTASYASNIDTSSFIVKGNSSLTQSITGSLNVSGAFGLYSYGASSPDFSPSRTGLFYFTNTDLYISLD